MTTEPDAWMPRARWDALVRGEGCPLCEELASTLPANHHGHTIVDLRNSRLRLAANQSVPGYCVLICRRHVREPYELTKEERDAFFDDMIRAALAVEKVFEPVKMNFEILGNAVPHLHAHVKPRCYGDPAPGRPIHPDARVVRLSPEEYARRVEAIRSAL